MTTRDRLRRPARVLRPEQDPAPQAQTAQPTAHKVRCLAEDPWLAWPAPARTNRFACSIKKIITTSGSLFTIRAATAEGSSPPPINRHSRQRGPQTQYRRVHPELRADLAAVQGSPAHLKARQDFNRHNCPPSKTGRRIERKHKAPSQAMGLLSFPNCSAYTLKDDPQPQVLFTFGLSNLK